MFRLQFLGSGECGAGGGGGHGGGGGGQTPSTSGCG